MGRDTFNDPGIGTWDTSSAESVDFCFFGCRELNCDLRGWDMSAVLGNTFVDVSDMFNGARRMSADRLPVFPERLRPGPLQSWRLGAEFDSEEESEEESDDYSGVHATLGMPH